MLKPQSRQGRVWHSHGGVFPRWGPANTVMVKLSHPTPAIHEAGGGLDTLS